jgi:hypothetical protein
MESAAAYEGGLAGGFAMKNALLAAVIVVLIVTSGWFAVRCHNAESRLEKNVAWTRSLMDSVAATVKLPPPPMFVTRDSTYFKWVAASAEMNLQRSRNVMEKQTALRQTVLDEYGIADLKERGLTDPAQQLRQDLISKPALIPFPGVLGGTMSFEEPYIVLLKPPYVFAAFDDGHIVGHMLLSYTVEDGKIEWKRLWSVLD